jgi:positive regulator of sigma E activity
MTYLNDDKGNKSSLRAMLAYLFTLIGLMVVVWIGAFISETFRETPDYSGLAQIIGAIMGGGVVSLAAKVVQKKFETKNDNTDETD